MRTSPKATNFLLARWLILSDEDMSDLPLPTTKAIEVLQFAPAAQVDPMLFNRSYYVEPELAGARAYVLLRNALEQSGRVAVAQVALRQRGVSGDAPRQGRRARPGDAAVAR